MRYRLIVKADMPTDRSENDKPVINGCLTDSILCDKVIAKCVYGVNKQISFS